MFFYKSYQLITTVLIVLFFSQAHAQVTTWVTRPGDVNIFDGSDVRTRISDDGRYVVFSSSAANIVTSDTNKEQDIFLKDMSNNSITMVSTNSTGGQYDVRMDLFSEPSSNGNSIVIGSTDTFFSDPFIGIKNLNTGVVSVQTYNSGTDNIISSSSEIFLSNDGRYLTFETRDPLVANDTDSRRDIYRKDLITGALTLISVNTSGQSAASDVFLLSVSRNSRYVTFYSRSNDIHVDSTTSDLRIGYIRDMDFSTTQIVSLDTNGDPIEGAFASTATTDTGNVYFCSRNGEHVNNDNNGFGDLFKYSAGSVTRLSFASVITEVTDDGCDGFGLTNEW